MKLRLILRIIFYTLAAAVAAMIFYLTAQTAVKSAGTSHSFIERAVRVFFSRFKLLGEAEQYELVESLQYLFRKGAHFAIYFALAFFLTCANETFGIGHLRSALYALPAAVLYAVSDEVHQYFVPGRSCQLSDILLDSFGAIMGTVAACLCTALVLHIARKRTGQGKMS